MASIIEIDKKIIPYRFELSLSNKVFTFEIKYNSTGDYFTVDLSDSDGVLVKNEKIVLGTPLFLTLAQDSESNFNERFFREILIAETEDETIERVGYLELGESVFLYIFTREELGL